MNGLRRRSFLSAAGLGLALAATLGRSPAAQVPAALERQLQRIFGSRELTAKTFGPAAWFPDGRAYAMVERDDAGGAARLVSYDTASGTREVLADASALTPPGAGTALTVDAASWTSDRRLALVFANAKRVWREKTRGDYWVFDRAAGSLKKLGGDAPEASLMFAKISPDGSRVAYVRSGDIYVEAIASGQIERLTNDASDTIVNGTSDWVNEEELGIRDGFRWSPDGRAIAYWQFDTSGVERFTLVNDTDTLYPMLTRFPYPKAGTTNSAVRIGVVDAGGGATRWMQTPGDPRNSYLASLQWTSDGASLLIQQLNRLQNTNDLLLADPRTGNVRRIFRDVDRAWVDRVDDLVELDGGRAITWTSEKDGWRHLYRVALDGSGERLLTPFDGDVVELAAVDQNRRSIYVIASPGSAPERFLYRAPLQGGGIERVTTPGARGTHAYQISPDGRWALHTASRFDAPPRTELVSLPDHRSIRPLADNGALSAAFGETLDPSAEFFTLDIGNGVTLDGWLMKPSRFDAARKYPLIVYVYGEPAGVTVVDRWAGSRGLFHRALANEGYLIASFDNRGTPAPKGAAWRKVVYGTVGDLSSREQAAAVRALSASRPYVDVARVGVWGWSGGGSNTLNCMFRFPEVFAAGVSVAPVPDQRLYDTIYQERYMGLPQDNAAGYRIGSPINFAEGLRGRLLVVHGSGDDNVHFQGTERLVNRLVELGKPFDFMMYPNRTHAISEGEGTSLHLHALIARHFLAHLPPGPRSASSAP
jgi:dipeptidyl-peptidase-4